MPDVSIVIVSWNARRYLAGCLESIAETAGHLDLEIIVVDNASSDGSPEMVHGSFPHVRLICSGENLGFAKANNLGLRAATGGYAFLINSDVVVRQGCLENLKKYLDTHPRVGMAAPRILNADGSLQPSCRRFPRVWNSICEMLALPNLFPRSPIFGGTFMHWWPHDGERRVEVLSGCFWAARREAVDEVGLLDESYFIYGEDIDWCKSFHQGGWDVVFFPGAEAIHFEGASSSNAPVRFYVEMQKARLQYWRKHHGRCGLAFCWTLSLLHQTSRLAIRSLLYVVRPASRGTTGHKIKRSFACLRRQFRA